MSEVPLWRLQADRIEDDVACAQRVTFATFEFYMKRVST